MQTHDQAKAKRMIRGGSESITVAELSCRTGLSLKSLFRRLRAGQLPGAHRIGRRVIVNVEQFYALSEAWQRAEGRGD